MAALYLILFASKGAIFLSVLYKFALHMRCRMMGRICFLIALCSVIEFHKRVLLAFAGFLDCASSLKVFLTKYSDFGCGFLAYWCFSRFCSLFVAFLVFFLVFKALQFRGYCKYRNRNSLTCSNGDQFVGLNNLSLKSGTPRMSGVSSEGGEDRNLEEETDEVVSSNCGFREKSRDDFARNGTEEEDGEGCYDEDQVFDVMSLRKMVKVQRQQANTAERELEKERMAAASAADEAMAMILRFQNEKSYLQMQVNQLQRLTEERELYDESVIQSLEWIIMNHEYERSLLVDQLRICREKLRLYVKDEESDLFDSVCSTPSASSSSSSSDGNKFDDMLISSLELESSPM